MMFSESVGSGASLSATKKEVRNGFLFSFVATGVDETKGAVL